MSATTRSANSTSRPRSRLERLAHTIAAFAAPGYAVIDGGLFEDLPRLFKREKLFARSLFLDRADIEVQKAGPWLLALDQATDTTARVLALPAAKPFVVFWSCAGGEAILHRHLRTLTMARIPDWVADGKVAPHDPIAPDTFRTVFFRHYDPRVLGALLPVLDASQFARIVGPAEEIAFDSPDYGGFKRVIADPAWPAASAGFLTVRSAQCSALINYRISAAHRRIASYLRDYAPARTSHFDDAELLRNVKRYDDEAQQVLGVRNENAIALWSYMQATSRSDLSRDEQVIRFMSDPACGETPDVRMQALFDLRTRLIRKVYG